MKKVFLGLLLASQASYSMIAPQYVRARQIDLAVTKMATEYFNFAGKVEQTPISSIKYIGSDIQVGINNTVCTLSIKVKPLAAGMVGVPGYSAELDNNKCGVIRADLSVAKYGTIKKAIDAAAAKSVSTLEVQVSKKGIVKLISK